jgi:hypothetical protein
MKMNSHTRTVPEGVLLDNHFMVSSAVFRDSSSSQTRELEHLKIKTRLIDEKFTTVMGERFLSFRFLSLVFSVSSHRYSREYIEMGVGIMRDFPFPPFLLSFPPFLSSFPPYLLFK